MQIDHLIAAATDHLVARLLRRALIALAAAAFAIVALYDFTLAGSITLAEQFGALDARLLLGGLYAGAALISLSILWAMRARPAKSAGAPALSNPREMQLVMLVEAVMLGYALARRGERAR
jgi:hypothetical protein